MDETYLRVLRSFGWLHPARDGLLACFHRKEAYACDITYATSNEIGFDFLRDQIALFPKDQVHRPFVVTLIDEADSILIDEARIPRCSLADSQRKLRWLIASTK